MAQFNDAPQTKGGIVLLFELTYGFSPMIVEVHSH